MESKPGCTYGGRWLFSCAFYGAKRRFIVLFCVMSTHAIGESEARSTSRGQVSGQNARKSRGKGWYNPLYDEIIPGYVKCATCNHPPARQPSVDQTGQPSPKSENDSHDSFEGQGQTRPTQTFGGAADDDLLSFAPPGHLRMIEQISQHSDVVLPAPPQVEQVRQEANVEVTSEVAAGADRKHVKLSAISSSRYAVESRNAYAREQLAHLGGGDHSRSSDHYYRVRRLPEGCLMIEGHRGNLRRVMREINLVMSREGLIPVESDSSTIGANPTMVSAHNRAVRIGQRREVVRNVRAFYNHRRGMQSMRLEIPGWVIESLAAFQVLPYILDYAVFRAVETVGEVWAWWKAPKPKYEAKIIMHDHRICGSCPQGETQVNCSYPSGGVLVDRGLLAYLRKFSNMQTRNRNLFITLTSRCLAYQKLYAVSDVCMARISPGTVMCAYMFSKEEELALSLSADTAMGDNLMRATNRQMGNTIRFMPHRNWREAFYFGGFSGWYHHVTGGTTVVGNR